MQSILLEIHTPEFRKGADIVAAFPKNSSTPVRKIGKYFVKKLRKLNLSSSVNDNEVIMKLGSEFKADLIETMHLTGLDLSSWILNKDTVPKSWFEKKYIKNDGSSGYLRLTKKASRTGYITKLLWMLSHNLHQTVILIVLSI